MVYNLEAHNSSMTALEHIIIMQQSYFLLYNIKDTLKNLTKDCLVFPTFGIKMLLPSTHAEE